jgi:hypothetical protein
MHSELEEGQTMVSPLQLASMLVDWMDPEKAVYVSLTDNCVRPLTISTEKCPVARRTMAFTSISPLTSSRPFLMTILHVRKITIPQTAVARDIIRFARRRAQENFVSVVKQAPPPRYRRREQDPDTETPDLQRAVGERIVNGL